MSLILSENLSNMTYEDLDWYNYCLDIMSNSGMVGGDEEKPLVQNSTNYFEFKEESTETLCRQILNFRKKTVRSFFSESTKTAIIAVYS